MNTFQKLQFLKHGAHNPLNVEVDTQETPNPVLLKEACERKTTILGMLDKINKGVAHEQ